MKRYKINNKLIKIITNSKYSLNELNKLCKFNIKNIYYYNQSINEEYLDRLTKILRIDKEILNLKKFNFDYSKNFGHYSYGGPFKFNGVSTKFAEFIGIMLGDGNIHKNQLSIVIDSRDYLLKKHIKNLFKYLFSLDLHEYKPKYTNAIKLYKNNKKMISLLIRYGLKRGNKIKNNICIPNWIKAKGSYIRACLRGLILTDGCLYYCKRDKKFYIKFTNHSFTLLEDFKYVAKKIGFNFVKANRYNVALYRKNLVVSFINEIKLHNLYSGS